MPIVLFVSPTGALINGAEKAGVALMAHLVDAGFRVINAFPQHYKNHDPEKFISYRESMQSAGIEQLPLDYGWWIPGDDAYAQREFTAVDEIASTIRLNEIDTVVSNTSNVPWGALGAMLTRRRHLWLLHEFPTGPFSWLDDKYDFIAEFSSAVFCASPSLGSEVRSRFARAGSSTPIRTFRPYSDVSTTTLAGSGLSRIVVVGSVNRRKNQLEAVRMLPALRAAGLSPTVLFIGGVEDEDYRAEIDQVATDLGVADQLHFLGHLDGPWAVVSPMDIVLQCSETETFSLVACEAAKLGLRLILASNPSATDIGSVLEGVTVYGAGDVDRLASIVERMLREPDETLRAAAMIRDTAERVLSRETSHAPILDELTSAEPPRASAVSVLTPFFSAFVSGTRQQIATLSQREAEAASRVRDLESRTESLTAQLGTVYTSRTWRLGSALSAPVRAWRRRHWRHGHSGT